MLRAIVVTLTMIFGAKLASAQEAEIFDAPGIEATISGQMEAFRDEDPATAFSFASPMIRSMFGNPGNFGMMVQRGYPMVWDNREVEFLQLREENGLLLQRILIRDSSGAAHQLDYNMIELEGRWLIDGVSYIPQPGVAA